MKNCSCTLLQQLESYRPSVEPARQALSVAWMTPVPTATVMAALYPNRCEACWASSALYELAAVGLRGAVRKINNYSAARCTKQRMGRQTMWLVVPAEIADHLARIQQMRILKQQGWL